MNYEFIERSTASERVYFNPRSKHNPNFKCGRGKERQISTRSMTEHQSPNPNNEIHSSYFNLSLPKQVVANDITVQCSDRQCTGLVSHAWHLTYCCYFTSGGGGECTLNYCYIEVLFKRFPWLTHPVQLATSLLTDGKRGKNKKPTWQ